jgi:hypothetical protein
MDSTIRQIGYVLSLGAMVYAASCGGSSGSSSTPAGSVPVGQFAADPASGELFLAEGHEGGQRSSFRLVEAHWGRLVDVYDFDALAGSTSLVMRGAVIDPLLAMQSQDHLIEADPIDGSERLVVRYPAGSESFRATLKSALDDVQPIADKSLDPGELPPWSSVPRNAALLLRFNDLIDASTVDAATVRLFSGYAPSAMFAGRVLADRTRGNLLGDTFHSTRVIFDPTVSEAEAMTSGLPVYAAGLPEAVTIALPNLLLELPVAVNPPGGQPDGVRSLGGRALDSTASGSNQSSAASASVIRAFRSRGRTTITGDPTNGYLTDPSAPHIVGNHAVHLTFVAPGSQPGEFVVDILFAAPQCAPVARENDGLTFNEHTARVLSASSGPLNGVLDDVVIRLTGGNPATFAPMTGWYADPFTGSAQQIPSCYVSFLPASSVPPSANILTNAKVMLRFSEPIDPATVRPLDSFYVLYQPTVVDELQRRVVGDIVPDQGLRTMLFVPRMPLRHLANTADPYRVVVLQGLNGVRDLAGNALAAGLIADFTLGTLQPAVDSGSTALRFHAVDEDNDGRPEVRGAVFYDPANERVIPREVTRFSALADTTSAVVNAMTELSVGAVGPLSHYGAKSDTTWRYHDLGFSLRDTFTHDLDVEGLNWAPFTTQTVADSFEEFEIALAHSKYLPDEALDSSLLPRWPISGVVSVFANNPLDPLTVVHPRSRGYSIDPLDRFTAASGRVMTPWPLNEGIALEQFQYWTWRDTSKLALGAPGGNGADTQRLVQVTKVGQTKFYPPSQVPTIGLPLLMEFRTWPDAPLPNPNALRVAIAVNSSARPFFRAHSVGGVNPSNPSQIKIVDPDTEPNATGGYGPFGFLTPGMDNVFAYGQADFVIRVSRMHTRWFDTGAAGSMFADPYLEFAGPLPAGTQVSVALRGATGFTGTFPPTAPPYVDATLLDSYGDGYTVLQATTLGLPSTAAFTPTFFNVPANPADRSWKTLAGSINGARFVQARATFVSNAVTGLSPNLSALGLAYRR